MCPFANMLWYFSQHHWPVLHKQWSQSNKRCRMCCTFKSRFWWIWQIPKILIVGRTIAELLGDNQNFGLVRPLGHAPCYSLEHSSLSLVVPQQWSVVHQRCGKDVRMEWNIHSGLSKAWLNKFRCNKSFHSNEKYILLNPDVKWMAILSV